MPAHIMEAFTLRNFLLILKQKSATYQVNLVQYADNKLVKPSALSAVKKKGIAEVNYGLLPWEGQRNDNITPIFPKRIERGVPLVHLHFVSIFKSHETYWRSK